MTLILEHNKTPTPTFCSRLLNFNSQTSINYRRNTVIVLINISIKLANVKYRKINVQNVKSKLDLNNNPSYFD